MYIHLFILVCRMNYTRTKCGVVSGDRCLFLIVACTECVIVDCTVIITRTTLECQLSNWFFFWKCVQGRYISVQGRNMDYGKLINDYNSESIYLSYLIFKFYTILRLYIILHKFILIIYDNAHTRTIFQTF